MPQRTSENKLAEAFEPKMYKVEAGHNFDAAWGPL
jgi:hypothetical protein